ncbi:MAG: Hsp20/alpha crystallin family protein [Acidobacteriota bacterium]|nr:Hsp20/alpha crystallin family protein [Acidobacteriota bacterium]MDH3524262.1 Hsp20/alpha crystallin family protein [Acidobacteriota bacterium]
MTRSLVRWAPRSPFARQMGRLMDEAFNEFLAPMSAGNESLGADWVPDVDIREDANKLLFTAEMPGLERDQVEITLENNVLSLSGERTLERDEEKEHYHRIERAYGKFARSFRLPSNVDTQAATATFKDGLLTIELPKTESAKPKKLQIT